MNLNRINLYINELLKKEEFAKILPHLEIGIELEVIGPWKNDTLAISNMKKSLKSGGDWDKLDSLLGDYKISTSYHGSSKHKGWRIEPDASLPKNNGLEIISPVYNYQAFLDRISEIVSLLLKLGFSGSSSTGLHLNFSADNINLPDEIKDTYKFYKNQGYSNFFSAVLAFGRDERGLFSKGDPSREKGSYSKSIIQRARINREFSRSGNINRINVNLDDITKGDFIKINEHDFISAFPTSHENSITFRNKYVELRGLGGKEAFEKLEDIGQVKEIIALAVSQLFRPRKSISKKEEYKIVKPYIDALSKNYGIAIEIAHETEMLTKKLSDDEIEELIKNHRAYDILKYDVDVTEELLTRVIEGDFYGEFTNESLIDIFVMHAEDKKELPLLIKVVDRLLKKADTLKEEYNLEHLIISISSYSDKYKVAKELVTRNSEKIEKIVRENLEYINASSGLKYIIENLGSVSEETQKALLEHSPSLFRYIKNPSSELVDKYIKHASSGISIVPYFPSASDEVWTNWVNSKVDNYYMLRTVIFPYKPKAFEALILKGIKNMGDSGGYTYITELESVDEKLLIEFAEKYPIPIYKYFMDKNHKISQDTKNRLIEILNSNPAVLEKCIRIPDIYVYIKNPSHDMMLKAMITSLRNNMSSSDYEELRRDGILTDDILKEAIEYFIDMGNTLPTAVAGDLDRDYLKKIMSDIFDKQPLWVLKTYIEDHPKHQYRFRMATSYVSWLKTNIPKDIQNKIKNNENNVQNEIIAYCQDTVSRYSYPFGILPLLSFAGWSLEEISQKWSEL